MKIMYTLFVLTAVFSKPSFSQKPTAKGENKNVIERTHSREISDYDSRVYNECTSEWVHLKGKITYSIKEMRSDDKYSISYQINLSQVEGVGETTGTVYKGGGVIRNRVNAVNKNGNTEGGDLYKVRYKAPNSTLIFTQHAHFVFAGGEERVSFNDASDSCK